MRPPLSQLRLLTALALSVACGRPVAVLPPAGDDSAAPDPDDTGAPPDPDTQDSGMPPDTGDSGGTDDSGGPDDTGDTGDTGDPPDPGPQAMIRALSAPMLIEAGAHGLASPADIAALGFDTVDMTQPILLGPDGVVSTAFSEAELTERISDFADAGLQISLTYVTGYTSTGQEAGAVWGTQYTDEGADIEVVLGHLTDHMISQIPLYRDLGVMQLSVYEPDLLFYEKTNTDGSPNFDAVSAWSQTHLSALRAAGWGDGSDEQLVWKFGYYYVPPTASGSNVPIDIDFSGYDGAGFNLSAEDASWEAEPEIWKTIYRNQVDRFLEHFADSLPDANVWPAVTEFGAADASCGFWNGTEESCEKYWSEGHIEAAFEAVLSAVRDWNADHDGLYRGVYVLDSPTDSGLFGLASSEDVQLAVQEGLAELE